MTNRILISILVTLLSLTAASAQIIKRTKIAQPGKRIMTIEDVVKWNRITQNLISSDGAYIAVKLEPWKGDSKLKLYSNKGVELFSADSVLTINFDSSSNYLLFDKGEKEKINLVLYALKSGEVRIIGNVKSYKMSKGWDDFVFFHKRDSTLGIESLSGEIALSCGKVTHFKYSEEEYKVLYTNGKDVMLTALHKESPDTLWRGDSQVVALALSESGKRASFVAGDKLMIWQKDKNVREVANGVSEHRELSFSPDGSKLYYGVKPLPPVRDSSFGKDELPVVQVWHWREGRQFTQQVKEREKDKKRSYLAVYNFESDKTHTITNDFITDAILVDKGNSPLVAGLSQERYLTEQMWTGRAKYDLFIINTELERNSYLKEGIDGEIKVSPAGKFLYWYSAPDSSWFTCSLTTYDIRRITNPKTIIAYDELNDMPDWPYPFPISGWSEDDRYLLVNDRYDIWQVDPDGREAPVNITKNGSQEKFTYRVVKEKQDDPINLSKEILLTAFDNVTKGWGYYLLYPGSGNNPQLLRSEKAALSNPVKAKNKESYIFTVESYTQFPDLWFSENKFKKSIKITNANPQQNEFIWGSAQLVKWTSYDGKEIEGVVYKPENFDPAKKYPLIVNFYDKNSSALYSHRIPEAHRSTIDYHLYNSNGYIIFNPDIVYKEGYPGESAFNCVMPGISALIEEGYIDVSSIGAQGHSWGAYQVAYLATRTSLFAAIESGAPVVNMFSAYGGIRWGTGLNRSFQYEHQQSRIGKTPWESQQRYIENSPLFTMDKVTTPVLIMHNDRDGYVPWEQGIEFFTSLKRLQKPVWLLNYTGEDYWPLKLKNKIDFQKRMMQFFNHYLKGEPMPEWMEKGVSAIELDYRMGY